MTASTVEGTPLRHNGTDWAAIDLSVLLSVRAIHQLPVTPTCLPAPLSSLPFCLFHLGLSQTSRLLSLSLLFPFGSVNDARCPQGRHLSVCLISPRCTFSSSPCTCASAEPPVRLPSDLLIALAFNSNRLLLQRVRQRLRRSSDSRLDLTITVIT